jgi:hypothetical protein
MRLLLLSILIAPGCVMEPYLQWNAAPQSYMPPQGRVAIKYVPNRRPPKHGDNEMDNLGNERSGFGIPYAIRLQGEQNPPLDQSITQMVVQSMAAAGIGSTQVQDPYATAHLSVEIQRFWCDGYGYSYKADVALNIVILDPRTGGVRTQFPVVREGSGGMCREAYRRALSDVSGVITQAFAQPGIRAAVVGAAPPPMQQPQPQPGIPPAY